MHSRQNKAEKLGSIVDLVMTGRFGKLLQIFAGTYCILSMPALENCSSVALFLKQV